MNMNSSYSLKIWIGRTEPQHFWGTVSGQAGKEGHSESALLRTETPSPSHVWLLHTGYPDGLRMSWGINQFLALCIIECCWISTGYPEGNIFPGDLCLRWGKFGIGSTYFPRGSSGPVTIQFSDSTIIAENISKSSGLGDILSSSAFVADRFWKFL